MEILLVNPPVNRLCEVAANYFPLGLGYLAAITNCLGYKTWIYNAELETRHLPYPTNRRRMNNHQLFVESLKNDSHYVWQEYRELVTRLKPRIVGFSCTSASIMPCLKMAKDAKRICGAVTVFGGVHPTILPEDTLRYKDVDYIVIGEAEKSFPSLVAAIEEEADVGNIPGVGEFRKDQPYLSPALPLEHKIEDFPFPDRDSLLNMREHRNYLGAMIRSRGCPYPCTFCSGREIHRGRVRYRPVKDVIEEIRFLMERYDTRHITFYDDALVLNKKRMVELCEEMINENLEITWGGFTRANSVDRELLRLMKASGCTVLGCGVESGSDRVLRKIKKGYTRAQAVKGIQMIKKEEIAVGITIMIGFPFERQQDIKDTIRLIKELDVQTNINTLTPYPGSELYDECKRLGLIKEEIDWTTISQHSLFNSFVNEISIDTYKKLLSEMIDVADSIISKKQMEQIRFLNRVKRIWNQERHQPIAFVNTLFKKAIERVNIKRC